MKKITKYMAAGLALFTLSVTLQAQVTITQATFTRPAGFQDSIWLQNQNTAPLPTHGAAQVWDYSNLQKQETRYYPYEDATQDPNFPGALNKEDVVYRFQIFEYNVKSYEAIDNNGWYEMGLFVEDTTMTLAAVSGSANDSIRFVGGVYPYQGRINSMRFPTNYLDSWTESYNRITAFELTVGAFGLNKMPGENKRTITTTREIVGYGTVKIPTQTGPSKAIEVLLTRWVRTAVDTFYIGGQLAPAALLNAFNISQGMTVADSVYSFYTPGLGAPVVAIEMNGNVGQSIAWRPQANTASVANVPEYQLVASNIFPNPVSKNGELTIVAEGFQGDAQFRLTDVLGRVVFETITQNRGNGNYGLQLPAYLPTGNYFYQLTDEKAKNSAQGKISVE